MVLKQEITPQGSTEEPGALEGAKVEKLDPRVPRACGSRGEGEDRGLRGERGRNVT